MPRAASKPRNTSVPALPIRGDKLPSALRERVLNAFPYRWTTGNRQRLQAYQPCPLCDIRNPAVAPTAEGHNHPTIPLISDEQWLAEHAFWFKDGQLDPRKRFAEPAYMADRE